MTSVPNTSMRSADGRNQARPDGAPVGARDVDLHEPQRDVGCEDAVAYGDAGTTCRLAACARYLFE